MGFSRQEYWSGLPFPPPSDLPDPGIKPTSLMSPALAGGFFITSTPWSMPHLPLFQSLVTFPLFDRSLRSMFIFLQIRAGEYCVVLVFSPFTFILAALGLHCCTGAFSSCAKLGVCSGCSAQVSLCGGFLVLQPGPRAHRLQ